MASLRRRGIGVAGGVPAVGLVALYPAKVWAATQCDIGTNPISGARCAIDQTIADAAGNVAQGFADQAERALTKWVVDGAVWLLQQLADIVFNSTSPVLSVDWFRAHYADMIAVAWVVAPIFLLLGVVQAILRSDLGLLGRILGQFVVVALMTTGAVVLAQLLIGTVDQLSGFVSRNSGADLRHFLDAMASTMTAASGKPSQGPEAGMPLFFAFLAAVLTILGAVLIWLELLARTLVIYAALLFFPVLLAAALWPRASNMVQLLAEALVAVIVSKFIIVVIVAAGVAALTATGTSNAGPSLLVGGGMLLVAAWAPWKFYRLMPTMEAAMTHQVGRSFHQGLATARWRGQQAVRRAQQSGSARRLPVAGSSRAAAAGAVAATAGVAVATNVAAGVRDRVANGGGATSSAPIAPRPASPGVPPVWKSMGVATDADSFFNLTRVRPQPAGSAWQSAPVAKDASSYFKLLGAAPKPSGGANP